MKNNQAEILKKELFEARRIVDIIDAQRPSCSDFKAFRDWEIKLYKASSEVFKIKDKIRKAGLFDYFFDNGWFLP